MQMNLLAVAALLLATPASAAEVAPGGRLYQQWCSGCHDRTSTLQPTMPGTTVLAERYGSSQPGALVDRRDLTPEFVRAVVRQGLNLMPHFRKTELSDPELNQLIAFLVPGSTGVGGRKGGRASIGEAIRPRRKQ